MNDGPQSSCPRGSGFAGSYNTQTMESKDALEQESDMMERLPTRQVESDIATDAIPLVSLGCSCAPKLSFKEMGRGSETLPFDWVRTTMDGLVHFLCNDFLNFFDFNLEKEIQLPGSAKVMVMYRSPLHSFWHDNPTMPSMLERYRRRIVRFNSIDAETKPVLFVRAVASSDELLCASVLMRVLMQRFGSLASLLMIIDFQGVDYPDPFVVESEPNLMINFFNTQTGTAPHMDAIRIGLDWVAGRGIRAVQAASPRVVHGFLKQPTDWGLQGTSGVFAFEGVENGAASVKKTLPLVGSVPPMLPPAKEGQQNSDKLEHRKAQSQSSELPSIPLVSLGCASGAKLSFQAMGVGKQTLPFDWIRITLQGLIYFLRRDFDKFFEYTTMQDVHVDDIDMSMCMSRTFTMYRSPYHSFWYDDPRHLGMRETYLGRISNFNAIDCKAEATLFVRSTATTDEIKAVGQLCQILVAKFGAHAALLLIVDFQGPTAPGACVVESEPNLMIYFLDTQPTEAPYDEPIKAALAWVEGKPVSAFKVPDLPGAFACLQMESHSELSVAGVPIVEEDGGDKDQFFVAAISCKDGETIDSELMEKLPAKFRRPDPAKDAIPLVSLGCSCGPKLSFKEIGRGAETLPFDWVRTRISAVMKFITSNFEGFYDFTLRQEIALPDSHQMVMFRGEDHSFWHDDPTDERMRERYQRRIERFGRLSAKDQGLLFVRSAATSAELADAGKLSDMLVSRFGPFATLLFCVDFQGKEAQGACVVEAHQNLMLHFVDTPNGNSAAPYGDAVNTALDWIIGRSVQAMKFASIEDAMAIVTPTDWGLYGTGAVVAFDSAVRELEKKRSGGYYGVRDEILAMLDH